MMASASSPIPTSRIAALASADQTTYESDGEWLGFSDRSTALVVHAWSKEKLFEYLTAIFEETAKEQVR